MKNIKKVGYPVIVKPANLGSSVGISIANNEEEVEKSISDAIEYDTKIVVEKVIENMTEVNCSVLGNYGNQSVGVLEEVMGADEFLSYNDKYLGGGKTKGSKGMASTNRIIPARISEKMEEEIKETSKKVFKALNLSGVCRIDYLIDKKKEKFYVNEPNTIPGSLSFYLWEPIGKTYSELLDDIINIAVKDYKNRKNKTYSFDSNILSNCNGLKGSKGKLGK
jgi:D-alanine-D-alanine ligase